MKHFSKYIWTCLININQRYLQYSNWWIKSINVILELNLLQVFFSYINILLFLVSILNLSNSKILTQL